MKTKTKLLLFVCCLSIFFLPFLTFAQPPKPITLKDNLFNIDFINANQGWAVGYYGTILHTEDGGITWVYQQSEKKIPLNDVDFVDANNGWIVGYGPTILHTTDGGKTWSEQEIDGEIFITSVYFLNEKKGWIVGEWGTILATEDAGNTWNSQLSGGDAILYDICFADEMSGWAVGEFGTIFHTVDGGKKWNLQPSGVENVFFSCKALDSQNVWVAGIESIVLRTNDGGNTWAKVVTPHKGLEPFYKIAFSDLKHGMICGQGVAMYSDDGGVTWKPSRFSNSDISYIWLYGISPTCGSSTLWMVGENRSIFKSTNQGQEWKKVDW